MPLEAGSLIQVASGSSGTGTVSTFDVTLPNPTVCGNAVFIHIGYDTSGSVAAGKRVESTVSIRPKTVPGAFTESAEWVAGAPFAKMWNEVPWNGENSWNFSCWTGSEVPTQLAVTWIAFEMTGVMTSEGNQLGVYPATLSSTYNDRLNSHTVTGAATSLEVVHNLWWYKGNQLYFLTSVAREGGGGTPPAHAGWQSVTGGHEPWVDCGHSPATSRASGDNVRLNVAYIYADIDSYHDGRTTYATAPSAISMTMNGFHGDVLIQQRTKGRQAPNSAN